MTEGCQEKWNKEEAEILQMWRKMEETIEEKAKMHNLTAVNVKSIFNVSLIFYFFDLRLL